MTSYKTTVSVQRHFYDVVEPKSSSLRQKPGKSDSKRQRYHPVTNGSRTVYVLDGAALCMELSHHDGFTVQHSATRFSASDCQFESFATLDMNYIHLSRSRLADGWDVGLSSSMMAGLKSNW